MICPKNVLIPSVLKLYFRNIPPKVINYRDLKKFDNQRFMNPLQCTIREKSTDYSKNPGKFF